VNFYDECFAEIKARAEESGARTIEMTEVERLVVERSKTMLSVDGSPGSYVYKKPRRARKDKGISRMNNKPFEGDETIG